MKLLLSFKSRRFKSSVLVNYSRLSPFLVKFDFRKDEINCDLLDNLFDVRELNFKRQRLNYLFRFHSDFINIENYSDNIFLIDKKKLHSLDTYSISEISVNYIFLSYIANKPMDVALLLGLLNRISSRLEFHPFGQTNNHFFRNIIAGLCISVAVNDKNKFEEFSRYILYFINEFFSKEGLLMYEKSSNYQALFLKWQLQILFIFSFHKIETEYLDFFTSNIAKHLENYVIALSNKINIGDITPDVTSEDLCNSLQFFSNILSIRSTKKSFFDKDSGHGVYYFDEKSMIYFIQKTNIYKSSHSHAPSFNFVLTKNSTNIINDLGRINYTDEYDFQTKAHNHNSVFFYKNSKQVYLDFEYVKSIGDSIFFSVNQSQTNVVNGLLVITCKEDCFLFTYNLTFVKPVKLFFILLLHPKTSFSIDGLVNVRVDKLISASDYGVKGLLLNRTEFEAIDSALSYNMSLNIFV